MVKKDKSKSFLVIILFVSIFGLFYLFTSSSEPGIEVQCNTHSILGFGALKNSTGQAICYVETTVTSDGVTVCIRDTKILGYDRGFVECDPLRNFIGKDISIKALFLNPDGSIIGNDSKIVRYDRIF